MWIIIPILALIISGLVAFLTRDWRRAVLVGVVSGVLGGLFFSILISTGVLGG